jgi:hypothetical protein
MIRDAGAVSRGHGGTHPRLFISEGCVCEVFVGVLISFVVVLKKHNQPHKMVLKTDSGGKHSFPSLK